MELTLLSTISRVLPIKVSARALKSCKDHSRPLLRCGFENTSPTIARTINKMEGHRRVDGGFVSPECTVVHLLTNHGSYVPVSATRKQTKRGAMHFDSTRTFDLVPCAPDATLNAPQRWDQPGATHNVGKTWLYTIQPVPDVLHPCLSQSTSSAKKSDTASERRREEEKTLYGLLVKLSTYLLSNPPANILTYNMETLSRHNSQVYLEGYEAHEATEKIYPFRVLYII